MKMIDHVLLDTIKSEIAERLGWDFGNSRASDLERGLIALAKEHGIHDTSGSLLSEWLESLQWNHSQLDHLTRYLTVGETYFFREKAHLDYFTNKLIPELLTRKNSEKSLITIWSAGCCTGEEPYSLAILLKEQISDPVNCRIIGTDVNKDFLSKARKGVFNPWSFRETPEEIKTRYFTKVGNKWEISQEIKSMVTFSYFNLASDDYFSILGEQTGIDVIFCRNVLMYFTRNQIRKVSQKFHQCLNEGGYFIPGVVEVNDENFIDFAALQQVNCTVYKRISAGQFVSEPPANQLNWDLPPTKKADKKPLVVHDKQTAKKITLPPPAKLFTQPTELDPSVTFKKGLYHKCITDCIRLLQGDQNNITLITFIVKSFANLGSLEEARHWGAILIEKKGIQAIHYYLVANIMIESVQLNDAELLLKKALYLDPHHLVSQFLMGQVSLQLGKAEAAKKHMNNTVDLLKNLSDDEIIEEADGLTAGRIREMISLTRK